ncbi:MAG TPA: rhomboid family intramembrane serine protease [Gemmataceae bacterium]|jgi:membrane associated rhomboid family serine protease|nr:rhomboid family intramembrane serine protease [Gemmataceae bacterium]
MLYMQVDVPMQRLPVSNWLLIGVTVLASVRLFLADGHAGSRGRPDIDFDPQVIRQLENSRLTNDQRQEILKRAIRVGEPVPSFQYALNTDPGDFRPWQLVTYLFVHADVWHLFGNMLFLFCFGNAVNAKLGHLPFVGLYLLCGVFAGVGWLAFGSEGPLVGASGAISGITGVFLVLYPLNRIAIWDMFWMWITGDALHFPSWVFIVFYMAMDFVGTLTAWGGSVAYVCHLAGETLGIAIAFALVRAGLISSGRGERNLLEIWGIVEDKGRRRRRARFDLPPAEPEGLLDS